MNRKVAGSPRAVPGVANLRRSLAVLLVAATCPACFSPVANARSALSAHASRARSLETGIESVINEVRLRHQLGPLRLSTGLAFAAAEHSVEMATRGYFKHASADGRSMAARVGLFYSSRGFRSWQIGENLLWWSPTTDSAEAVQLWMASPEHRANLLDRGWAEMGCAAVHVSSAPGVYRHLPATVVTCDFGARR